MTLYAKEVAKLHRIIKLVEKLIAESPKPKRGRPALYNGNGAKKRSTKKRIRRSGSELIEFRKMLKGKRKKGVSVVELAGKCGISPAYIYQL